MKTPPSFPRRIVLDIGVMWLVVTIALVFLVSPNPFTFAVPPGDNQDGLAHGLLVKTVMEIGWYPVAMPRIGAPFGSLLYDYPFSDGLNLVLIKLLGLFTTDWVVASNLFFIAGFYLAAATSYYVFRRLHIAPTWAVVGGILFAFLPYHLLRREHLLLVSYFTVPLGVLLAWLAWRGDGIASWRAKHVLPRVALVLATGSGGVYYAFFSAALVALAALTRMVKLRSWRAGAVGGVLVAGIALTVLLNVLPSLVFWATNGPNPEAVLRPPSDSERFGLRLTQMVMPQFEHRIDALRAIAHEYRKVPLVNENQSAALGFVGCAGLLALAVMVLRRMAGARPASSRESFLAVMGVGAFLIGTIGGVGALFAYTVSPLIRGYNRISVTIAFIALAALFIALQRIAARARLGRAAVASLAVVVVVLGVLDQTPRQDLPPRYTYRGDREFVRQAEAVLPRGTMVWQVPYQPFPESWEVYKMPLYSPLRGYLNSDHLRWSFGAIRGREADRWIRGLGARPLEVQIDLAAKSGFGAIYVDRRGFADGGEGAMAMLTEKLGPPIAQARDGDLAMFRLTPTGTKPLPLRDVQVPMDTPIPLDHAYAGPLLQDISGFGKLEPEGRWTIGPVATIELVQPLPMRFTLRIETWTAMPAAVQSGVIARVGSVERRFEVKGGRSVAEVPFVHSGRTSTIEILIPKPSSPKSAGMNDDERMLGIGIKSITILPPPAGS